MIHELIYSWSIENIKLLSISIMLIVGVLWVRYRLTHDPLPKRLPKCIWHTKMKQLTNVYDGDTFHGHIKGHSPIDKKPVGIRIRGIDTPEMKDHNPKIKKKALEAKEMASKYLKSARTIHLYNVSTADKYGRILADVYCDGINLSKRLLDSGLAQPYDGGTKTEWK